MRTQSGGHTAEDRYKQWLAAHHIPTGDDSWYGAGIGSADVISVLLGAGGGGAELGRQMPRKTELLLSAP